MSHKQGYRIPNYQGKGATGQTLAHEGGRVAVAAPQEAVRGVRTFQALGYRNYRYLWLGQLGFSASLWMEQVARPWLMLELTGSAVALGLVMAARMAPMLIFGLLAGVAADRFDRRRILHICQMAVTAVYLLTALLIISDLIQPWQVYLLAFATGAAMAFNQPARQALIPSLVEREHLTNAIALNTVAMNVMRVVGASLGGVLIATMGLGGIYVLNAALLVWVQYTTLMIRMPAGAPTLRMRQPMFSSLAQGLVYAWRNRVALAAISLAMALFLFGLPYNSVFIPLFAKYVLETGSTGMGLLMATTGVGALLGALAVATVGNFRRRGQVLIGGVTMFGAALVAFSAVSWLHFLPLSYLIIAIVGFLQTSYLSINNAVILESAPSDMHGRVASLISLDRGLIPLGGMIASFLAASAGPQTGLIIFGGLCIAAATVVAVSMPSIRRID